MGSKFKYFVIGLLFFNVTGSAQQSMNFQFVDSLTFKYYNSGDWDTLIKLGNEAIKNGIDYKYLRQRLGFACFSKEDYVEARKHFSKAMSYDSFDRFTLIYWYYSYLLTTQSEFARPIAGKMPPDLRKSVSMKPFQPIESVDLEYNFKYAASVMRSGPQYFHFGINSFLGKKLELYQMYSYYSQNITFKRFVVPDELFHDRQQEYFALVKYKFSPHWMIKSAFHYLYPDKDTLTGSAHLGFFELSSNYGRFNFALNTSVLKNEKYSVVQTGIQAGLAFAGKLQPYFTGALSMVSQRNTIKMIFNQTAGFRVSKTTWLEGNFTFGDITNYHDHDAMYVYNLIDPTTLRAGATFYIFCGRKISIWANYAFELKEYHENNNLRYNQFSYLGGIKWKL
jgi:hypothetical protein